MRGIAKRRRELIHQFGGSCSQCGYSRCERALHFHHTDASEKSVWSGNRGGASIAEIATHPERFVLLCANCHTEHHEAVTRAAKTVATCRLCGKVFTTEPGRSRSGRAKYCSRKCTHAHRPDLAQGSERERFWRYVAKTDTCWLWTGYVGRGGSYLNVKRPDGRNIPKTVGRISYELHHGPIPRGKRVQRSCGENRCVRPDHLFITR